MSTRLYACSAAVKSVKPEPNIFPAHVLREVASRDSLRGSVSASKRQRLSAGTTEPSSQSTNYAEPYWITDSDWHADAVKGQQARRPWVATPRPGEQPDIMIGEPGENSPALSEDQFSGYIQEHPSGEDASFGHYHDPAGPVLKIMPLVEHLYWQTFRNDNKPEREKKSAADEMWQNFDATRPPATDAASLVRNLSQIPGVRQIRPVPNNEINFKPGDRVQMEHSEGARGTVVKSYPAGSARSKDYLDYLQVEPGDPQWGLATTAPTYDVQWDYKMNPRTYDLEQPGEIGPMIEQHRLWPEGDVRLEMGLHDPNQGAIDERRAATKRVPDLSHRVRPGGQDRWPGLRAPRVVGRAAFASPEGESPTVVEQTPENWPKPEEQGEWDVVRHPFVYLPAHKTIYLGIPGSDHRHLHEAFGLDRFGQDEVCQGQVNVPPVSWKEPPQMSWLTASMLAPRDSEAVQGALGRYYPDLLADPFLHPEEGLDTNEWGRVAGEDTKARARPKLLARSARGHARVRRGLTQPIAEAYDRALGRAGDEGWHHQRVATQGGGDASTQGLGPQKTFRTDVAPGQGLNDVMHTDAPVVCAHCGNALNNGACPRCGLVTSALRVEIRPGVSFGDGEYALCAYKDGQEIGHLYWTPEGDGIYLDSISVDAQWQRQGVATQLVDELLRQTGKSKADLSGEFDSENWPDGGKFWPQYFSKTADTHDIDEALKQAHKKITSKYPEGDGFGWLYFNAKTGRVVYVVSDWYRRQHQGFIKKTFNQVEGVKSVSVVIESEKPSDRDFVRIGHTDSPPDAQSRTPSDRPDSAYISPSAWHDSSDNEAAPWTHHTGSARLGDNNEEADQQQAQGAGAEAQEGASDPQGQVAYNWPSLQDAMDLSYYAVDNHQGFRDPNLIDAAIGAARNQQAYGGVNDPYTLAAHLMNNIQRQQALVEGNKRTGMLLGLHFLEENGVDTSALPQEELADTVLAMAEKTISPEQVGMFLETYLKPRIARVVKTANDYKPQPEADTDVRINALLPYSQSADEIMMQLVEEDEQAFGIVHPDTKGDYLYWAEKALKEQEHHTAAEVFHRTYAWIAHPDGRILGGNGTGKDHSQMLTDSHGYDYSQAMEIANASKGRGVIDDGVNSMAVYDGQQPEELAQRVHQHCLENNVPVTGEVHNATWIPQEGFQRKHFKVAADVSVLAQNMMNTLLARPDIAQLKWMFQLAESGKQGNPEGQTPEVIRAADIYADIERLLYDIAGESPAAFKLMPWAVTQIKNTYASVPVGQNPPRYLGHLSDIVGQAGTMINEMRQQNKLPQGFDVNKMDLNSLQEWLYAERAKTLQDGWEKRDSVYTYPDNWSIDRVTTKNDLVREGEMMGHCVGGYHPAVESGSSVIYSLREPNGNPHTTFEVEGQHGIPPLTSEADANNGWYHDAESQTSNQLDPWNIVQIQGKQDTEPIDEYKARLKEFFQHHQEQGTKFTMTDDTENLSTAKEAERWFKDADESGQNAYGIDYPVPYVDWDQLSNSCVQGILSGHDNNYDRDSIWDELALADAVAAIWKRSSPNTRPDAEQLVEDIDEVSMTSYTNWEQQNWDYFAEEEFEYWKENYFNAAHYPMEFKHEGEELDAEQVWEQERENESDIYELVRDKVSEERYEYSAYNYVSKFSQRLYDLLVRPQEAAGAPKSSGWHSAAEDQLPGGRWEHLVVPEWQRQLRDYAGGALLSGYLVSRTSDPGRIGMIMQTMPESRSFEVRWDDGQTQILTDDKGRELQRAYGPGEGWERQREEIRERNRQQVLDAVRTASPAAADWAPFSESIRGAQPTAEGAEGGRAHLKQGVGLRWALNEEQLQKVCSVFGELIVFNVHAPNQGWYEGYGDLRYSYTPEGEPWNWRITLHAFLAPDAANYCLWHEIQHAFQLKEGRSQVGAHPVEITKNNFDQYVQSPEEVDADQMAQKLHALSDLQLITPIDWRQGCEQEYYDELIADGYTDRDAEDMVDPYAAEIPLSKVTDSRLS